MHRESVQRSGAERPIVVGDRLDTDIEGANAVGCPSLLVLSGVTDRAPTCSARRRSCGRPTSAAMSSALLLAHPQPTTDGRRHDLRPVAGDRRRGGCARAVRAGGRRAGVGVGRRAGPAARAVRRVLGGRRHASGLHARRRCRRRSRVLVRARPGDVAGRTGSVPGTVQNTDRSLIRSNTRASIFTRPLVQAAARFSSLVDELDQVVAGHRQLHLGRPRRPRPGGCREQAVRAGAPAKTTSRSVSRQLSVRSKELRRRASGSRVGQPIGERGEGLLALGDGGHRCSSRVVRGSCAVVPPGDGAAVPPSAPDATRGRRAVASGVERFPRLARSRRGPQ